MASDANWRRRTQNILILYIRLLYSFDLPIIFDSSHLFLYLIYLLHFISYIYHIYLIYLLYFIWYLDMIYWLYLFRDNIFFDWARNGLELETRERIWWRFNLTWKCDRGAARWHLIPYLWRVIAARVVIASFYIYSSDIFFIHLLASSLFLSYFDDNNLKEKRKQQRKKIDVSVDVVGRGGGGGGAQWEAVWRKWRLLSLRSLYRVFIERLPGWVLIAGPWQWIVTVVSLNPATVCVCVCVSELLKQSWTGRKGEEGGTGREGVERG